MLETKQSMSSFGGQAPQNVGRGSSVSWLPIHRVLQTMSKASSRKIVSFFLNFIFVFLEPHPQHVEDPRLGV